MKVIPKIVAVSAVAVLLAACGRGDFDRTEIKEMVQSQKQDQQTLKVAQAFLEATGSGNMEVLTGLMADDFVWHNEGDTSVPWIGNWQGKEQVLNTFLPAFGSGLQVTGWSTDYTFAQGNQAVFMGTMSAQLVNTGVDTGKFSWAARVHVENGKVKSWNWFEDSYAVSAAYHVQ